MHRINFLIGLLFFVTGLKAQIKSFTVEQAPISTMANDEFGPVFYNGGLVFCSNSVSGSAVAITSGDEKLFNLMFAEGKDSLNWRTARLFSKEITTILNEGPATFNGQGTKVFYVRNNQVEGKIKAINDPSNKLGIFSAELVEGEWTNITPFPFNSNNYSLGTPSLSSDGLRLYFASDMPGGYGGNDIYYCDMVDGEWQAPVNLGEQINTRFNESYPYACPSGRLFFSSDGHTSMGGKDIFYSIKTPNGWLKPIRLDADINSEYDDYGIVTDRNFQYGAFSTNRGKSSDIYTFVADLPQFSFCEEQQDNKRCFTFYDERYVDTLYLEYEWDFGNGIKKYGLEVDHCFTRGGHHDVYLNVLHNVADTTIVIPTKYSFDLDDIEQPFIDAGDVWLVGDNINFDATKTNLPQMNIKDYVWDFGEGFRFRGKHQTCSFHETGTYNVKLGVLGGADSNGILEKKCVSKSIEIVQDIQEVAAHGYSDREYNIPLGKVEENGGVQLQIKNYFVGGFTNAEAYKLGQIVKSFEKQHLAMNAGMFMGNSTKVLDGYIKLLEQTIGLQLQVAVHSTTNRSSKKNLEATKEWADMILDHFQTSRLPMGAYECIGYGDERIRRENPQKNLPQIVRAEFIFYRGQ